MHTALHPEHVIHAYQRERPSITRLIHEAQWAHYQLTYALEHHPDSDRVPALRRHKFLHLGALYDVLTLRTQDPDLYEAARDHGELLRAADGLDLADHPRNGLDHLRTQYGLLHGHPRGATRYTPPLASPAPRRQLPIHRAGPWLLHEMCDTYAWAALGRSSQFPSIDVESEQRRHLIIRGLLLDWAASATPADTATATAAARAGHALRTLDSRPALNDLDACAYLWDAFRNLDDQDEDDDPHPQDCAGGCAGDGELLAVLTWEHHGDGIYTAVHQEPIACLRTVAIHTTDCPTCEGHGYTYTPGYRELCLDGRAPEDSQAPSTTPQVG
ncbi:hypothetical protein [Streptomyces sp. MZ04]|uniref:hypothetical protein n=1 Tax=Streptomyces sp. MZ04 TaxID=2559236 RepID=UPI00107E92B3|nr:hypothetical protein [Streptomyces sp. MZ04]TGB07381.1 hypothetical protein E2651_21740 [Streptomyces sp. MZ04]